MEKSAGKNPNVLYEEAVRGRGDKTSPFWGRVPQSFAQLPSLISPSSNNSSHIDKIIARLREFHIEKGIYSEKVEENLGKLRNGCVLTGQQPVVIGGPSFIANKMACAVFIQDHLASEGIELAPVFMIGSYDGLQKELIRAYFPNPISPHATILDFETEQPEGTIAYKIELPGSDWLEKLIESLQESFWGFRKKVKGPRQKLLSERFDHIVTILKMVFRASSSFNDMFVRLWGTIANVLNDFGIIFFPMSDDEMKKLYVNTYRQFLDRVDEYTSEFEKQTNILEEMGFRPSLPLRDVSYSPFFIECPRCQIRTDPKIKHEEVGRIAHGHCRQCGDSYNYPVGTEEDLRAIASLLAPRVDTSQLVLQDLLNVKLRVSGPGEIAYYAQVAPALRHAGFEVPIFVKYKRLYYNTPWNESLGKLLDGRKQGSIHSREVFEVLKERMEGIKEADGNRIKNAEYKMHQLIHEKFEKLVSGKQKQDTLTYMSWQFGRFTPEKFGQESSWVWVDMALQTGITDYIQTYYRMYTPHSLPGFAYYTNTNL